VTLNHDLERRNGVGYFALLRNALDFKANYVKVVEGGPIMFNASNESIFWQYIMTDANIQDVKGKWRLSLQLQRQNMHYNN